MAVVQAKTERPQRSWNLIYGQADEIGHSLDLEYFNLHECYIFLQFRDSSLSFRGIVEGYNEKILIYDFADTGWIFDS